MKKPNKNLWSMIENQKDFLDTLFTFYQLKDDENFSELYFSYGEEELEFFYKNDIYLVGKHDKKIFEALKILIKEIALSSNDGFSDTIEMIDFYASEQHQEELKEKLKKTSFSLSKRIKILSDPYSYYNELRTEFLKNYLESLFLENLEELASCQKFLQLLVKHRNISLSTAELFFELKRSNKFLQLSAELVSGAIDD